MSLTNLTLEDLRDDIPEEDKTCGNCAHWGGNAASQRPLGSRYEYLRGGGTRTFGLYVCTAEEDSSIEPDVRGHHLIALGSDCSCIGHGAAFEPSDDYLAEHEENIALQRDPYAYNGVQRSDFM